MAADNIAALVNANSRGRSVIKIAEDAGLPPHRIQRYMRPSFELRQMPTRARMAEIATALDVSVGEVARAFAADLVEPPPAVVEDRRERELTALFRRMPTAYQETLLQMAKSLSHLERSVAQDVPPDLGDDQAAM